MFGSSSVIGRRPRQQDALCVGDEIAKGFQLFGIFDGHGGLGGGRCSYLASTKLPEFIRNEIKQTSKEAPEALGNALSTSFAKFDSYLKALPCKDENYKPDGQKRQSTFSKMLFGTPKADFQDSGSCACLVLATEKHFIVANLGDSRAIFSDGNKITNDHTPTSLSELERFYAGGGWALKGRAYGRLVPTRVFGDFELKSYAKGQAAIISEPEIHIIERRPDMAPFVVIMCDGIHDVMRNAEIGKICQKNAHLSTREIAELITQEAFRRGSKDNLSCIVIKTQTTEADCVCIGPDASCIKKQRASSSISSLSSHSDTSSQRSVVLSENEEPQQCLTPTPSTQSAAQDKSCCCL